MTALTIPLLVLAGLLGLVIGSFLNVVAYRVPAGIPLTRESRCPVCGAPVRPWQNVPVLGWIALRGRCASCRAPISARYPLVEAATGLAFVGVTGSVLDAGVGADTSAPENLVPGILVLVAFLWFASVSIVLTLIDLDTHRLPNAIVLPSYAVGVALLTLACVFGADWAALLRGGIGMVVLYAFYFALRLVRPDGMGGGDVKLAGVIGLHLAWIGWGALAVGGFAAFVLGGVYGVALLLTRRAGRRSAIPFGPWMIAGAWLGIVAGEALAGGYLHLVLGN